MAFMAVGSRKTQNMRPRAPVIHAIFTRHNNLRFRSLLLRTVCYHLAWCLLESGRQRWAAVGAFVAKQISGSDACNADKPDDIYRGK